MTPQELREIALKKAQIEFDKIILLLTEAANAGQLSGRFPTLSDGTIQLLKDNGYEVIKRYKGIGGEEAYWEIKF